MADHFTKENSIIEWDSTKIVDKEEHKVDKRGHLNRKQRQHHEQRRGHLHTESHLWSTTQKHLWTKTENLRKHQKHGYEFSHSRSDQYQLQHQLSFDKIGCWWTKVSVKKHNFSTWSCQKTSQIVWTVFHLLLVWCMIKKLISDCLHNMVIYQFSDDRFKLHWVRCSKTWQSTRLTCLGKFIFLEEGNLFLNVSVWESGNL